MIDAAGVAEMARIFHLQGERRQAVRATSAAERIAKLELLRSALQANAAACVGALVSDLGKPPFEAVFDFGATFLEIDVTVAGLTQWMEPTEVKASAHAAPGATARITYEPKGRVLIFSAWNFPSSLLFQPLVGAIAAGNTVIVKPSEMAPATAAVAAKIIRETFDEAEVAVFQGGAEVAEALLELPFDHIFFTGSTRVGKRILTAAGRHLSTVTLELGGKCPAIVDDDVDVSTAASRICWGKFLNAGQICLTPDHVWVKTTQRDAFAQAAVNYVKQSYYTEGRFNGQDFARIVDERNLARVQHLLSEAVSKGAKIVFGGGVNGLQMEPTILVDVPRDCAIMDEEIFGPILPILTYEAAEDVVAQVNSREKPLGLYVFSNSDGFIGEIISRTSSGGVTVNDVIQHAAEPSLPFGGVGASGMGAYHGLYSFREMSHARSVYYQAEINPAEVFMRPPYGDRMPG